MKLLITGGTGFIGSRLALEVQRRGLTAVVAGQVNTTPERVRCEELAAQGIQVVQGPLQEAAYARQLVQGCEAVIHLAAAQHEANVPDAHFEAVNVTGTRTLLEACCESGVQRFVYGSTIGVYGDGSGAILDENSPPCPVNIYGKTKLAAESVVASFSGSLQTAIVRISETYGPGDFRLLKLFRAVGRGRFVLVGAGANRRQLIHVRDLVRLLLLTAQLPEAVGKTVIAAGGEVMTTRQMVEQVARALGRPLPRLRAPLWPFLAVATLMEGTLRPLGIQPPLHRRRLDFFRKSFVFDTSRARLLLGFTPEVPFTEGAAETAAWYRERGYLSS
jgi:nucleoside-diphosphate-sugar epimerase